MKDRTVTDPRNEPPDPFVSVQDDLQGTLHLRVAQNVVRSVQAANIEDVQDPNLDAVGFVYVISSDLQLVQPFAGGTARWLRTVASLVFRTTGTWNLWRPTSGDVDLWYDRAFSASEWVVVNDNDVLLPSIYEFRCSQPVTLSRISERPDHSLTSQQATSKSSTFRRALEERDVECVVTGTSAADLLIASHLIPKRMGDEQTRKIVAEYADPGNMQFPDVHSYHPIVGILLFLPLDARVDRYTVGFYKTSEREPHYVVHNFADSNPYATTITGGNPARQPGALLHGYTVTLELKSSGQRPPLPPAGIFAWHYLQCVIKKFGTPQYKNLPNVTYYSKPFRTSEDNDGDEWDLDYFDDNPDITPPYPSFPIEQALAKLARSHIQEPPPLDPTPNIIEWQQGVLQ